MFKSILFSINKTIFYLFPRLVRRGKSVHFLWLWFKIVYFPDGWTAFLADVLYEQSKGLAEHVSEALKEIDESRENIKVLSNAVDLVIEERDEAYEDLDQAKADLSAVRRHNQELQLTNRSLQAGLTAIENLADMTLQKNTKLENALRLYRVYVVLFAVLGVFSAFALLAVVVFSGGG